MVCIISSEVKPGRSGLVIAWVTQFKQKPCCAGLIIFFILVGSFSSHYHSFSLVLKHRESLHFWNVIQSQSWASVIFSGPVLSLKFQIELSGIHRLPKVNSAEPQGVRKSNFYSESLSVECLCCYICDAACRGFHTKRRIWFILIKTYQIATFIGYLD